MSTIEPTSAEKLLASTIRIETETQQGTCTGTGFFFNFNKNPEKYEINPYIVTNKHVIKNSIKGHLIFSVKDESSTKIPYEKQKITIDDFESKWIMHPDENVDLCILPITDIHQDIRKNNVDLYYSILGKHLILPEIALNRWFSRIEDVITIGYPDGIWDDINNIPIIRKGITATPLQIDFRGAPEFLIDSAIYPGSSGSPVFVFKEEPYPHPQERTIPIERLNFVGIVYAMMQHTVTGELKIIDIPVTKIPYTQMQVPNNLGVVIHARKLLDFENII